MASLDKMFQLQTRLTELERRSVRDCDRPILDIARQALLLEIARLGRQMARWGGKPQYDDAG